MESEVKSSTPTPDILKMPIPTPPPGILEKPTPTPTPTE